MGSNQTFRIHNFPTAFWKASGMDITLFKSKIKYWIHQQQSSIYGQLGQHKQFNIVLYSFLERGYLLCAHKILIPLSCQPSSVTCKILHILNIQLGRSMSM